VFGIKGKRKSHELMQTGKKERKKKKNPTTI
jgi:hypothetical protein